MKNLERIWRKYLNNEATGAEMNILKQSLEDESSLKKLTELIKHEWDSTADINPNPSQDDLELLTKIKSRLNQDDENQSPSKSQPSYMRWYAAAASILVLISLGLWLNTTRNTTAEFITVTSDLASNIKQTLPDGTVVWLKPQTKLAYKKNFSSNREVILEGSAFFDVRRDAKHPFQVKSGPTTTTVLGTSFNVLTLDSIIEVVVSSGQVSVNSALDTVQLAPDEKARYNLRKGSIQKSNVDNRLYTLWFKKQVRFDSVPLKSLVVALEEKFKKQFTFKDNEAKEKMLYSLTIEAEESIEDFIERINFLNEVQLKNTKSMIEISTAKQ